MRVGEASTTRLDQGSPISPLSQEPGFFWGQVTTNKKKKSATLRGGGLRWLREELKVQKNL